MWGERRHPIMRQQASATTSFASRSHSYESIFSRLHQNNIGRTHIEQTIYRRSIQAIGHAKHGESTSCRHTLPARRSSTFPGLLDGIPRQRPPALSRAHEAHHYHICKDNLNAMSLTHPSERHRRQPWQLQEELSPVQLSTEMSQD